MSGESAYEKQTRKWFFLGPGNFLAWRDYHRGKLNELRAKLLQNLPREHADEADRLARETL